MKDVSRRRFLRTAGMVGFSPITIEPTYPRWMIRDDVEVTRHTVLLKNLPCSFDGLKVVHLTDIHHSKYVSFNKVYRMVSTANRLSPDLIFLTGDYVTWSKKYIQPVSEALKSLSARLGIFAVLGNHDFKVGADAVATALELAHIRVLRNGSVPVQHSGECLWVAGVDEYSCGQSNIQQALRGIPNGGPKILLAHNPEIISEAALHGVDFILAGHTHGGQVNLPYLNSLHSLTQPNQDSLQGFVVNGNRAAPEEGV